MSLPMADDREEVTLDHPDIVAHLERQANVPDGFVKLDTGEIRPVGGHANNGEDNG